MQKQVPLLIWKNKVCKKPKNNLFMLLLINSWSGHEGQQRKKNFWSVETGIKSKNAVNTVSVFTAGETRDDLF